MIAGSPKPDKAGELLEQCALLYNAGIRMHDFSAFLALLTEDAILEFEGVPDHGPFSGKSAIAQHFEDDPPDDQIRIERWKYDGVRIIAEISWIDIPESGGCLFLQPSGSHIARITVVLGGPRRRFR